MSKLYFVLYNKEGCELARGDVDSSYPSDGAADYAGQMIRWMQSEYLELSPGDSIKIEEVE